MDGVTDERKWDYNERRAHLRRKISLKRTFAAEIDGETKKSIYLYVVDISHGGMRILVDFLFPEARALSFKLIAEEPLEFTAEMVWHKMMIGDMYMVGMKFVEPSQKTSENIDSFIGKYSGSDKTELRLNRMFVLKILNNVEWKNYPVYALSLSLDGLEFTSDKSLEVNEDFLVQFHLDEESPPFQIYARVLYMKEISDGRFKGFFEFDEMQPPDRLRFMERMYMLLKEELPTIITEPISNFEVP